MDISNNIKGKVILAGAGPGDPELITVKVARYLRLADVVLTDRLVSEEILNTYVRKRTAVEYPLAVNGMPAVAAAPNAAVTPGIIS